MATATLPDNLSIAGDRAGMVQAFAQAHRSGVLELPPVAIKAITAADTLERARRDAGRDDGIAAAIETAVNAIVKAAAAGKVPPHPGAEVASMEADAVLMRRDREILERAAAEAGYLAALECDSLRPVMSSTLASILAEAAPHAAVVAAALDAGSLDVSSPDSLLSAVPGIRAAWSTLMPIAARHDQLRMLAARTQVGLPGASDITTDLLARSEAGEAVDWSKAGELAGFGVAAYRSGPGGAFRWSWRPSGSPVVRLVIAATKGAAS